MAFTQPLAWQQEAAAQHKLQRPPVLIVIPAFNEEACIQEVITDLLNTGIDLHILVINDGSEDRTEGIIREAMRTEGRVFLLNLPNNIGIGGAVQAGFKFACRKGYEIVIQVDGDGQHRGDQLDRLMEPLKDERADIVIGSRFLENNGFSASFFRKLGIKFFTLLISLLTARRVTDPTSGFRAFSRRTITYLAENYADDYPEPESLIMLHRRSFRFMEVPVIMNCRAGGKSSISPLRSTYYMIKVTIAILIDHLRRAGKASESG